MANQNTPVKNTENSGREKTDTSQKALHPTTDLMHYFQEYARSQPEMAALWCFGFGFIVGWKLKPW